MSHKLNFDFMKAGLNGPAFIFIYKTTCNNMAQIGITKYRDLLNKTKLQKLKDEIQDVNIEYKKIANDLAVENRESEIFEQYIKQYSSDLQSLINMRKHAAEILRLCDEMTFIISRRSIQQHVYNWDDEITD